LSFTPLNENEKMKTQIFCLSLLILLTVACRTLTSTTTIKPNDAFVLGNNEHGEFSVRLKNTSRRTIEIHEAPITGGKHSFVKVEPGQTVKAEVDRNTALIISNVNDIQVDVELLVKGDVGLSMGYKN
jgi:hypothetical protein